MYVFNGVWPFISTVDESNKSIYTVQKETAWRIKPTGIYTSSKFQ